MNICTKCGRRCSKLTRISIIAAILGCIATVAGIGKIAAEIYSILFL